MGPLAAAEPQTPEGAKKTPQRPGTAWSTWPQTSIMAENPAELSEAVWPDSGCLRPEVESE